MPLHAEQRSDPTKVPFSIGTFGATLKLRYQPLLAWEKEEVLKIDALPFKPK